MDNPHGGFIWYELITTDPTAAGKFYAEVVGWTVGGVPGSDYQIFSAAGTGVCGLMALPPGAAEGGMRPGWLGYIGVDDVDRSVAAITAAGGAVHMPAQDMAGVGRMALVADPQGVAFYVMRGVSEEPSTAFDRNTAGHCSWNELATSDQSAALDFYTGLFGWTNVDTMSMGAMGDYKFIDHAGVQIGAVMPRPAGGPPPNWTYYFRVPDIEAAGQSITKAGGGIIHGPSEIPGGDHILVASDPQGAAFAIVGKKR